jgi:2-hydroxychromene-2-carboxylate isomerase
MLQVEFYFHYGCPWTYLAFTRLRETALRTGAGIVWKPITVEHVHERLQPRAAATHGAAATLPAKARYAKKDLADWAAFCGVTIRHQGPFPLPAEWAARGAIVTAASGRVAQYSEAVFSACFRDAFDIGSLDAVVTLAGDLGLDEGEFRKAVCEPAVLRAVESNADELVARGGFGSPSMFIGDDMYFGNDRMPLVEFALNRRADRPFVAPGAHGQALPERTEDSPKTPGVVERNP